MRILHLIPSMLGGGAERQLCYLSEAQSRAGHDVHVGYMLDGPNTPRLERSGSKLHRFGWRRPFDPRLLTDVRNLVKAVRPDVVQTWMRRMDLAGGLVARPMGVPWVYSERNVWTGTGGWRERLRASFVDRASAIVANSDAGADHWRRRGCRAVFVAPNILPLDEISAAPPFDPATVGLPHSAALIAFAGRFDKQKNIPLLLEVLAGALAKVPQAVAVCCGVGAEQGWFAEEVRKRGLEERIRSLGYRDDVWSIFKRAQVMVSTSAYEGRPNVVLEAVAAGTVVALTDIEPHREVLSEDAAFFFSQDPQAGVDAVVRALSDVTAASERATRARRVVAGLSGETVAHGYSEIYERVIASASATRLATRG